MAGMAVSLLKFINAALDTFAVILATLMLAVRQVSCERKFFQPPYRALTNPNISS